MKVYVFGNHDVPEDKTAFETAEKLKDMSDVEFIFIKPNEDLPVAHNKQVVLLDAVYGIDQVTLIDQTHLDKLIINRSVTAHDYDLGFQLKYLIKLRKLAKISIIGLPQTGNIDYDLVQSILRKLVLQDIQGS